MPFRRPAVRYRAKINGQWATDFEVLEVEHSHGGTRLDFARLTRNYGRHTERGDNAAAKDQHVRDTVMGQRFDAQAASQGMTCEVFTVIGGQLALVHYGKLQREEISISVDGESWEFVSRADNTHFGKPIGFQRVQAQFRPDSYIDQEIVFNPDVEDVIIGNMRLSPSGLNYPIFIHPESIRTQNAADFQQATLLDIVLGQSASNEQANTNWNLVDAVLYLCGETNPGSVFVNPTRTQLEAILPTTRSLLKNHKIRVGSYLPECLDALLAPYGFSWEVDYKNNKRIRVFKRGSSTDAPLALKYLKPGEVFDSAKHDIERLHLDFDLSTAVNQVKVIGGFTQIEGTFELIPGWDEQYDGVDEDELSTDSDGWEDRPEHHRVRRYWVLGEGADYTRRDGFDLTSAFRATFGNEHPVVAIRRRRFEPALTRAADGVASIGEHSGVLVEWWDPEKEGGAGFVDLEHGVEEFAFRVLHKECGIAFTGVYPPDELYDRGLSSARVRITATIESDTRLSYTSKKTADSVSPELHEEVIDRERAFHLRKLVPAVPSGVVPTSRFIVEVLNGDRKAMQLDARSAIKQYADALRVAWDQADLSGTLTLDGCDYPDVAVGRVVNKIKGREIYLRLNRDSENPRYPQIVGVRHFPQQQAIHVVLQSFRETDDYLGNLLQYDRRPRRARD